MASGGSRDGAGRKPKREKFKAPIARAEKRIADSLPTRMEKLHYLADGGYRRPIEIWEPAGLQTIVVSQVLLDAEGKQYIVSRTEKAFPDLEPDQLVLIRKTVSFADPDLRANIYLADRIMGKPTERHEHDVDGGIAVRVIDVDVS